MTTPSLSPDGWVSQLPPLRDASPGTGMGAGHVPDRRDGAVYDVTNELRLAVDVSLATGRPLLLRGEPGSGKSSLAAFLARNLGWRYYEHVVTSRTRPRDLLWTFDAVRKLADASSGLGAAALRDHNYVEPGVMWWALNPESATRRGVPETEDAPSPLARDPLTGANAGRDPHRAVVLIDEIDKADPDLPNGLLVPLGSTEFLVEETGELVRHQLADGEGDRTTSPLLVLITTNDERDLPRAFLRRCITYELPAPNPRRLVEIGRRHLVLRSGSCDTDDLRLLEQMAKTVQQLRDSSVDQPLRPPSTAEFLDAVFACRALDVTVESPDVWPTLERLVLAKTSRPQDGTR